MPTYCTRTDTPYIRYMDTVIVYPVEHSLKKMGRGACLKDTDSTFFYCGQMIRELSIEMLGGSSRDASRRAITRLVFAFVSIHFHDLVGCKVHRIHISISPPFQINDGSTDASSFSSVLSLKKTSNDSS